PYDSQKMWAGNIPQLYTTTGADSLTINGLYSTATNPIVDLGVKLPSSGNYTLNATSITITNESVYLEDRMLNIFQDLNVEPNYSFTSVAGNIGDRFALHFNMSITGIGRDAMHGVSTQVYTSNGNTLNIILSENTENGKVDVMDMAGRIVGSFNLSTNRTSVNMNVSTGVYLVRVETENGMDTHRILLN
nr:T9SS type A sorting domain-containing protein [Flavobacteriales bacterium]